MNIALAVTGSIAAYKAAPLTRLWVKRGDAVQVLMTRASHDFITPLTLGTLSKRPVFSDVHGEQGWHNHVEIGLWADALVIAPATANTLAKLANGLCDNMVSAVYLSARCPVFVAPAMDLDMWKHPATLRNLELLRSSGVQLIPVGYGELASGLTGDGRMAEPEEIVAFVDQFFAHTRPLAGKRALVTAGPTYEAIDPVRFIGNHASGKMGIAIADALAERGAAVHLVLGPTHLQPRHPAVQVIRSVSAEDMYQAFAPLFPESDITVLSAAVADYRAKNTASQKIKKHDENLSLELARTIDIAATLGARKKPGQLIVGFALETHDETANATQKLEKKNFDFIVLNSLQDPGAGFGHDTNKVSIIRRDGTRTDHPLAAKTAVAALIVEEIIRQGNHFAHSGV